MRRCCAAEVLGLVVGRCMELMHALGACTPILVLYCALRCQLELTAAAAVVHAEWMPTWSLTLLRMTKELLELCIKS